MYVTQCLMTVKCIKCTKIAFYRTDSRYSFRNMWIFYTELCCNRSRNLLRIFVFCFSLNQTEHTIAESRVNEQFCLFAVLFFSSFILFKFNIYQYIVWIIWRKIIKKNVPDNIFLFCCSLKLIKVLWEKKCLTCTRYIRSVFFCS